MTRSDVMKLFPDATEEQITGLLNQYNADLKQKTSNAKEDSEKVKELQNQLDLLNQQNMTDIEKANSERDKALNSVADLQKTIKAMQTKTSLAELGIVGEQADKFISADGIIDFTTLGQIIADREKAAISNFEKQALKDTPNPDGVVTDSDTKTSAEQIAENIGKSLGGVNKTSNDIISAYL